MRWRWWVTAFVATTLAGCGGVPDTLLLGSPSSYLLGVDQLVSPDFSLDLAPHALSAADLAAAGGASATQRASAGFTGGAGEDFFRQDSDIAVLNGPAQVTVTVEAYSTVAGAATVYALDVTALAATRGATAVSTGSLGDAAHAEVRTVTAAGGTEVEQVTVEWRLDNLVDILVVRGRVGGVRPDDALILAHRQTVTELGLVTAAPG